MGRPESSTAADRQENPSSGPDQQGTPSPDASHRGPPSPAGQQDTDSAVEPDASAAGPLLGGEAAGEGDGEGESRVSEVDELVEAAEEAINEDVSMLSSLTAERDEYLDQLRRLQADFANYKKRIVKQQTEHLERAAEELIVKLLPVLDNFDLARAHGTEGLDPVYRSILEVLESTGLQRIDPMGLLFDPNEHDAVLHESAEDTPDGSAAPQVTEVLRAGYRWKGKVLRPAMVKVKG